MAVLGMLRTDGAVTGFVAYVCSDSSDRVDAYSLLELAACPTTEHHYEVERDHLWQDCPDEEEEDVPVFHCMVIKSKMSQDSSFNSAEE
jgi:hypothetical protein